MREHHRDIRDFLRSQGAEEVRFEHKGKHPKVRFAWKGEARFYVLPGTPGDTLRGAANAISDIRHMLGLVSPEKRVGERRTRRAKASRTSAQCPVLTPLAEGLAKLRTHPMRLDGLWLALWRDCMASVGGESRL